MPEPLSVIFLSTFIGYGVSSIAGARDTSASNEGNVIHHKFSALAENFERSQVLFGSKALLIDQLNSTAAEHDADNPDDLVDPKSILKAKGIIKSLPPELPLPEVSIDPDGDVALDWFFSRYTQFSLSVGNYSQVAYAWINGENSGRGVAAMSDAAVPEVITNQLHTLIGYEKTTLRFAA